MSQQPIDPDIDLHVAGQRGELGRRHGAVLLVIAAGGVVGAEARYLVSLAMPHPAAGFPLATFLINVLGCFLIGALMVGVTEVWQSHRLLRPFLGVGVLGGFTTFSTYATDVLSLAQHGAAGVALAYLAATPVAAVAAAWLGVAVTRWVASMFGLTGLADES